MVRWMNLGSLEEGEVHVELVLGQSCTIVY